MAHLKKAANSSLSLLAIGLVALAVFMVSFEGGEPLSSLWDEGGDGGNIAAEAFKRPSPRSIVPDSPQLEKFREQASRYADRTGDCRSCFDLPCLTSCQGYPFSENKTIRVEPAGEEGYKLRFQNKAGQFINQEVFAWSKSKGVFLGKVIGDETRDLVTDASVQVDDEDYFLISDGQFRGYSRMLQYKGTQSSNDIYQIRDVGSGLTYEVSYNGNGTGLLVLDGFPTLITGLGDSSPYIYADTITDKVYALDGTTIRFFPEHLFLLPPGSPPPLAVFMGWDERGEHLTISSLYEPELWLLPFSDPTRERYLGLTSPTGFGISYVKSDLWQSSADIYPFEG